MPPRAIVRRRARRAQDGRPLHTRNNPEAKRIILLVRTAPDAPPLEIQLDILPSWGPDTDDDGPVRIKLGRDINDERAVGWLRYLDNDTQYALVRSGKWKFDLFRRSKQESFSWFLLICVFLAACIAERLLVDVFPTIWSNVGSFTGSSVASPKPPPFPPVPPRPTSYTPFESSFFSRTPRRPKSLTKAFINEDIEKYIYGVGMRDLLLISDLLLVSDLRRVLKANSMASKDLLRAACFNNSSTKTSLNATAFVRDLDALQVRHHSNRQHAV
ncbi:hypothetical protein FALBO_2290 [Fusarium albosuccineum]|uniref:Uncharacterized protein n=1 Tax=Fusarium albosuccineum TaxID=1237068 RepID=A0A8H4LN10_9HYPO|nr:hypothetical protein FALBO_2290 [Fusarium albosuccineum]